mgnify:CR=1 FL=1
MTLIKLLFELKKQLALHGPDIEVEVRNRAGDIDYFRAIGLSPDKRNKTLFIDTDDDFMTIS